jgi:hypothetical protein
MFYDRFRGKNAGVTSWLRFPLRMLSVQQLFRMLRVLVVAEDLRVERAIGSPNADAFSLGYLASIFRPAADLGRAGCLGLAWA